MQKQKKRYLINIRIIRSPVEWLSQSRLVMDQNRPITMDLCHLSLTANNMMAKLTSEVTQTRLSTFKWPQPFTWLWGWLLHRLSWHQSPLATTVLLSTTLSHFLHSGNLNVWFKSNIVRRNKILVTDNPFTHSSDQDRISPYNINTISIRWVMRIKKNINFRIVSWSNTKLSELTLWELYSWLWGELQIWSGR